MRVPSHCTGFVSISTGLFARLFFFLNVAPIRLCWHATSWQGFSRRSHSTYTLNGTFWFFDTVVLLSPFVPWHTRSVSSGFMDGFMAWLGLLCSGSLVLLASGKRSSWLLFKHSDPPITGFSGRVLTYRSLVHRVLSRLRFIAFCRLCNEFDCSRLV